MQQTLACNYQLMQSDTFAQNEQRRLANFLSLANLQNKVPDALFQQLTAQLDQETDLPQRRDWLGLTKNCSFAEFDLISGLSSSTNLPFLLNTKEQLSTKIDQFFSSSKSRKQLQNPVEASLKKCHLTSFGENSSRLAQISNFKNRNSLGHQFSNKIEKSKITASKEFIQNKNHNLYHRMKTVFGHAIIADGSGTPVYNCKFDMSGKFVITGADDGIIKVWNRDNMILQASLHGHKDVIIDIAVSKCNRFMASGSKDGSLIIWDFQNCTIIKKLTEDHTSQINSLRFVMIECNAKQGSKNVGSLSQQQNAEAVGQGITAESSQQDLPTFDQFLVSCSDDGSINIYDVSSFTKTGIDEFYLQQTDKMFKPCLRTTLASNLKEDLLFELKDIAQVQFSLDDSIASDVITRKTRKRRFGQNGGITNQTTANSSSQSQPNSQEITIFKVSLRSEDFRAGTRNKHIDSVSVSPQGFVAGGTNHGEIYLWKVNFNSVRQRKVDGHFQWINSFKVHKKPNHYLDFNATGEVLMTGSADGTACLYDTSFVNLKQRKEKVGEDGTDQKADFSLASIDISDKTLIHRFKETSEKHNIECAIDTIDWSTNGRYAMCAISVKKVKEGSQNQQKENTQAVVRVKVFDTYSGAITKNLDKACNLGKSMNNFVSTAKFHPVDEHILLVCFDGGVNIIYDLRKEQIIQELVEFGIYSIDQYTMNNQMDVDFSPDGNYIAFSSIFGTTSLYSTHSHKKIEYQCTRVQQFFPYDNQNHDCNIFETLQTQPQLCGYELNPYEVQPTPPLIGKFKNRTDILSVSDFYKQQIFAREFSLEEENFYQNQLREGMRQGYFETGVSNDIQREDNQQRIISVAGDSPVRAAALMDEEMFGESDQELVGGTRAMRERRDRRLGNASRRLTRNDDQIEELEDSQEDEEFKQASDQEMSNENESAQSEEDFMSLDSEVVNGNRVRNGEREGRSFGVSRRENYHMPSSRRVVADEDTSSPEREMVVRPRRQQPEGSARNQRVTRQNFNSQSTNQSMMPTRTRNRLTRMRQVIHSGETSQFEERLDDQSNFGGRQNHSLRGRNRRQNVDLITSDEESARGTSEEEREITRRRNGLRQSSRQNYDEEDDAEDQIQSRRGVTRSRPGRRSAQIVDETDQMSPEEGKVDFKSEKFKADLELEKFITTGSMLQSGVYKRDEAFSIRDSKSKKNGEGKIAKQGRMSCKKESDELDYSITKSAMTPGQHACSFCNKTIEKKDEVGPFTPDSVEVDDKVIDSQGLPDSLYFHLACLEKNNNVGYKNGKWTNIKQALQKLVIQKSFSCYRCHTKGATIQCGTCDRAFHGHLCSKLYLIQTEDIFTCVFCQANRNFYDITDQILMDFARKEHLKEIRESIPREHLITSKPFEEGKTFVPQIGDVVYYFWQGHEQFHQSQNCFFFCGTQSKNGSTDLPWLRNSFVGTGLTSVRCQVLSTSSKFASAKAEYLLEHFGPTSFEGVHQVSQIVTYVELQILDNSIQATNFVVEVFPNETNFLVPDFLYEKKLRVFERAMQDNRLIGRRFRLTESQKEVQIIREGPVEPELDPNSYWNKLVVKDCQNLGHRAPRGRNSPSEVDFDEEEYRINFWDLMFPGDDKTVAPSAFDSNEKSRIDDKMTVFLNKNADTCYEFLERVGKDVANDYKSYISSEMWLQLVFERVTKDFYRSQDQLWSDLDLIPASSSIYNGEDEDLTQKARGMVEKLRKELKVLINENKEKKLQKPKDFKIDNLTPGQTSFGFTDFSFESKPSPEFKIDIGAGGSSIKELLNLTRDKINNQKRVTMDELEDGSNVIIIDFNAPVEAEEEEFAEPRKRGRPAKRNQNSQDFTIKIDTNQSSSCVNSRNFTSSSNQESFSTNEINGMGVRRSTRRQEVEFKQPAVGSKRTRLQAQHKYNPEEDDFSEGSEEKDSDEENRPTNTRRGLISIDLNAEDDDDTTMIKTRASKRRRVEI